MKRDLVPISARAVLQRINRKLRGDYEQVIKARGERAQQEVGEFYRIDFRRNFVVEKEVDLQRLGRELGVLKAWERLDGDDNG